MSVVAVVLTLVTLAACLPISLPPCSAVPASPCVRSPAWLRANVPAEGKVWGRPEPVDAATISLPAADELAIAVAHGNGISLYDSAAAAPFYTFASECSAWKILGTAANSLFALHSDSPSCLCPASGPCYQPAMLVTLPNGTDVTFSATASLAGPNIAALVPSVTAQLVFPQGIDSSMCSGASNLASMDDAIVMVDAGLCPPAVAYSQPLLVGAMPAGAITVLSPGAQVDARQIGADMIPFPSWTVSAADGAEIRRLAALFPGQPLNITVGADIRHPSLVLPFGSPAQGLLTIDITSLRTTGAPVPATSSFPFIFKTARLGFLESALGGSRPLLWVQSPDGLPITMVLDLSNPFVPSLAGLFVPSNPPPPVGTATLPGDLLPTMTEMRFFVDSASRHILVGMNPATRLLLSFDVSAPNDPQLINAHFALSAATTGLAASDIEAGRFFFPLQPPSKFADLSWTVADGFSTNRLFVDTTSGPKVLSTVVRDGLLVSAWGVQGLSVLNASDVAALPEVWMRAERTLSPPELLFAAAETFGARQLLPHLTSGAPPLLLSSVLYVNARPDLLVLATDFSVVQVAELLLAKSPELFPFAAQPMVPAQAPSGPSPVIVSAQHYTALSPERFGTGTFAESFYVDFDQPIFYKPPFCPMEQLCEEPTVADCCDDCLGPVPDPASSTNTPGCLCPSSPAAVCIGPNRPQASALTDLLSLAFGLPTFELGVRSACLPFALLLESKSGNADMLLSWQSGQAYGNRLGNDHFLLCTDSRVPNEPLNPSVVFPQFILQDRASTDPFARAQINVIVGFRSEWQLQLITPTPAAPLLQFPLSTHYNLAPFNLLCSGSVRCQDGWPSPVLQTGECLLRSYRPGFSSFPFLAERANLVEFLPDGVFNMTSPLNRFIGSVPLLYQVTGVPEPIIDLNVSSCQVAVRAGAIVSATGAPVNVAFNPAQSWLPALVITQPVITQMMPVCDAAFRLIVANSSDEFNSYDNLYALISNNPGTLDFWSFAAAATTDTPNGYGCDTLRAQLAVVDVAPNLVEVDSTICPSLRGTTEYATDPCCNVTLQLSQCCASRVVRTTAFSFSANEANANLLCTDPDCASNVIEDGIKYLPESGAIKDFQIAIGFTCGAEFSAALNPILTVGSSLEICDAVLGVYQAGLYPCATDSDCLTGSCLAGGACARPTNDIPYALCVYAQVPSILRLSLLGNLSVPSFLQRYMRPATGTAECNYNPSLPEAECVSASALQLKTDRFCALRLDNGIKEVSVFGGCAEYDTATYAAVPYLCELIPDVLTGSPRLLVDGRCWLAGSPASPSSRNECLPPNYCNSFPGGDVCPAFCWVDLPQWACSCAVLGAHPLCATLQWFPELANPLTGAAGLCKFVDSEAIGAGACELGDYMHWWPGRVWVPSQLTDEAACVAGGCASPTCEGCDFFTCLSEGSCSETGTTDICVFPVVAAKNVQGSFVNTCARPSMVLREYGCVDLSLTDAAACAAAGGTLFAGPGLSESSCVAFQSCFVGSAGTLDSKNATSCAQCGGVIVPRNKWTRAVWYPPGQLEYLNRSFEVVVPASASSLQSAARFDRNTFQFDLLRSTSEVTAGALRSFFLCNSGRLGSLNSRLACNCGEVGSDATIVEVCATIDQQLAPLAFVRACGGAPYPLSVPKSMYMNVTTASVLVPPCFEMQFLSADWRLFRKSTASALDSAFVQSIALRALDVVREKGIVIGRVVGSGVMIVTDPTDAVVVGGVELCLVVEQSLPADSSFYRHYDYAFSADAVQLAVDDTGGYTLTQKVITKSKIRPLGLQLKPTVRAVTNDLVLCATIELRAGLYVPIVRAKEYKDPQFWSTLSDGQQASLIILILFYFGLCATAIVLSIVYAVRVAIEMHQRLAADAFSSGRSPLRVLAMGLACFVLIALLSLIRWLFFLLVAAGVMKDAPGVINAIMSEVPTYLYLSLFTVLLLVWSRTILTTNLLKSVNAKFIGWLLIGIFALVNVLLWVIFVAYVIVYAVEGESSTSANAQTGCRVLSSSAGAYDTKVNQTIYVFSIVYHFIVATLAALASISFVCVLIGVWWRVPIFRENREDATAMVHAAGTFLFFSLTVLVSAIALLAQAVLLVVTSFVSIPTEAAMILLIFIEWLPCAVILFTLTDFIRKLVLHGTARTLSAIATSTGLSTSFSSSHSGSRTPDNKESDEF